jgi:type II secretion system protein H
LTIPKRVQAAPLPGRRWCPGGGRGFTLLELLVVLTIVGILAGLVVPSLRGTEGRRLHTQAEQMVLLVNRARQEAVLSSRIWRLVLEPAEGRYRFQRQGADGEFAAPEGGLFDRPYRTEGVDWRALSINGQTALSDGEVLLFPTGEQDSFRLTLGAGGRTRTVRLQIVGPAELLREAD